MASLRVVRYVERNGTRASCEIKRLFRIHRERDDSVLVIERLAQLAVAYNDIEWRNNSRSAVATNE